MRSETVPIDSLSFDPANVRKHGERNLATIKASLLRFGQQKPIVVDANGVVRAGNGTLAAAKALGWKEIAVVRSTLAGSEATAYAIADNRTAELAEWDEDALAETLSALQCEDEALLDAAGFDSAELSKMIDGMAEVTEDEVPEPPAEPITKPGDLWLLGEHRVLCGDSTKAEDVERLMAGAKADLCFTSPPYALGKSVALSGNKKMSEKANAYDEHEDNAAEWAGLMAAWFAASDVAVSDAWVVNVQPLAGNKRDLVRFLADNAGRLVDVATWDKGHAAPPMAAGVMASRYEWMIIFAATDGASRAVPLSSWRGTVQSVYAAPPQRGNEFSEIHAATMPLHVPAWVMKTLCDQSQSVYEPFCGTGTTLIAAEQLGRKCYGMEISPAYCDVIVKRWETLTGRKATRG
jgi:ParB-like chromosome segregation protein Spo0J